LGYNLRNDFSKGGFGYARLKKVYNYYYNNGELLKDPFNGVKMPKKGEAKVTHLNNDQMDNVLSAVYLDFEPQDPMYVGILLAFYAGLRRGEICGLRWNDKNTPAPAANNT
jgi:integrase